PKTAPAASSSSTPANAPSTPAPAASASTPAPPPAPVAAASSSGAAVNVPSTPTPAMSATNTEGASFNDPNALALGQQRASAVTDMENMGFERSQIDRAMRAAFNNPDRAVEYLLSGIPENLAAEEAPRPAPAAPQAATEPTSTTPAATTEAQPTTEGGDDAPINLFEAAAQAGRNQGGSGGGARSGTIGSRGTTTTGAAAGSTATGEGTAAANAANLDFLRNNPQFQQLRQIVQTQPQMLEPILQQVASGNPQLAQMIGQNPEQFLQLLSEDADEDAPLPPGATAVSVTEEEREAIERLCRLGFERDLVIQAYFACDKNEELAANFLFDQPPDEDQ
ncbi:hypothetical protein MMC10_006419, partial [Thelotrema lepadinum]|nr:hypothetical protein [Thelotrema lepadinum]